MKKKLTFLIIQCFVFSDSVKLKFSMPTTQIKTTVQASTNYIA